MKVFFVAPAVVCFSTSMLEEGEPTAEKQNTADGVVCGPEVGRTS